MNTGRLKNILLIDDDPAVARSLQLILQRSGYVVKAVGNGSLGLQWLEKQPVDLIITDIYMDVMDGIATVSVVKKQFPQVKIIAISGGSRVVKMDSLSVVKTLGADRTLTKPMDISVLLALIAELDAEAGG